MSAQPVTSKVQKHEDILPVLLHQNPSCALTAGAHTYLSYHISFNDTYVHQGSFTFPASSLESHVALSAPVWANDILEFLDRENHALYWRFAKQNQSIRRAITTGLKEALRSNALSHFEVRTKGLAILVSLCAAD